MMSSSRGAVSSIVPVTSGSNQLYPLDLESGTIGSRPRYAKEAILPDPWQVDDVLRDIRDILDIVYPTKTLATNNAWDSLVITSFLLNQSHDAVQRVNNPNLIQRRILTVSEQLNYARTALGINIKQLADILGVSRPTIYAWTTGNNPSNHDVRDKIKYLYEISVLWNNMDIGPLGIFLTTPLQADGSTILDHIKTQTNKSIIKEYFDIIRPLVERKRRRDRRLKNELGPRSAAEFLSRHIFTGDTSEE